MATEPKTYMEPMIEPASACIRAGYRRTYVRMTSYVISDAEKPWLTLFSSPDLEFIAEAVAAQERVTVSSIYATLGGKPRALTARERIELFESVLALRPHDATAEAELGAARRQASY